MDSLQLLVIEMVDPSRTAVWASSIALDRRSSRRADTPLPMEDLGAFCGKASNTIWRLDGRGEVAHYWEVAKYLGESRRLNTVPHPFPWGRQGLASLSVEFVIAASSNWRSSICKVSRLTRASRGGSPLLYLLPFPYFNVSPVYSTENVVLLVSLAGGTGWDRLIRERHRHFPLQSSSQSR